MRYLFMFFCLAIFSNVAFSQEKITNQSRTTLYDKQDGILYFNTDCQCFNYKQNDRWYELKGYPCSNPPGKADLSAVKGNGNQLDIFIKNIEADIKIAVFNSSKTLSQIYSGNKFAVKDFSKKDTLFFSFFNDCGRTEPKQFFPLPFADEVK
jgi:hypothetical protein